MEIFWLSLILIFCTTKINLFSAESLPQYTCNIISDLREKNDGMKTTALIKGDSQLDSTFTDELLQCMPMEISVVSINGDKNLKILAGNSHQYSAVVMIADKVDEVS